MSAREEGLSSHRIVFTLEQLIRGFEAIGLPPEKALALASAHTIRLEARRWWERRGYTPPKTPETESILPGGHTFDAGVPVPCGEG